MIGHRGETLDALQYLSGLVANHVDNSYYRITLDIGNYREKRRETLEALGKKMAAKAVRTGRNTSLEPMNPYERRIIHTAVQTVEGAKSWSEGEGPGPPCGDRSGGRRTPSAAAPPARTQALRREEGEPPGRQTAARRREPPAAPAGRPAAAPPAGRGPARADAAPGRFRRSALRAH